MTTRLSIRLPSKASSISAGLPRIAPTVTRATGSRSGRLARSPTIARSTQAWWARSSCSDKTISSITRLPDCLLLADRLEIQPSRELVESRQVRREHALQAIGLGLQLRLQLA